MILLWVVDLVWDFSEGLVLIDFLDLDFLFRFMNLGKWVRDRGKSGEMGNSGVKWGSVETFRCMLM